MVWSTQTSGQPVPASYIEQFFDSYKGTFTYMTTSGVYATSASANILLNWRYLYANTLEADRLTDSNSNTVNYFSGSLTAAATNTTVYTQKALKHYIDIERIGAQVKMAGNFLSSYTSGINFMLRSGNYTTVYNYGITLQETTTGLFLQVPTSGFYQISFASDVLVSGIGKSTTGVVLIFGLRFGLYDQDTTAALFTVALETGRSTFYDRINFNFIQSLTANKMYSVGMIHFSSTTYTSMFVEGDDKQETWFRIQRLT